MIEFSHGVFHTRPGTFLAQDLRQRLKDAGFLFHWGDSKCKKSCAGCAASLAPKTWVTANHIALGSIRDLLSQEATTQFNALADRAQTSRVTATDIDVPAPAGCEYKGYQKAAIAYALRRKRVLFADEMGTGKTMQALGWVNVLGDEASRFVVVCPASLKLNWLRECEKWLVRERTIEVVSSNKLVNPDAEVVIVNYERLVGARQRPVFDALLETEWDMLIVDEAHRIKTMTAQRSVAILGSKSSRRTKGKRGLAQSARRVALLSGSPIPNRPKEFYPIAQLLAPDVFGDEWRFLTRYCEGKAVTFWKKGPDGVAKQHTARNFDGARNLDELQQLSRANFMVRRLKVDVWKEMPPKTRQIIPVQCSSKVHKLNAELEGALIAEHGSFERAALELMQPKGQLPFDKMSEQRQMLGMLKVPIAIEHIDSALEQGQKVIVFAHHHCVVEALRDHYGKQAAVLYGPTSEKARQKAVDSFQNDKSVRVFIGTGAAGEGITLTASSHVVFVESSWVPGEVAQREDRAHRLGQEHPVLVQHLVWDGTVEAQMIRRVVQKQKVINEALDRKRGR